MIESKPYKKKKRDIMSIKAPKEFVRIADINGGLLGISRVDYFKKLTGKLRAESEEEFKKAMQHFEDDDNEHF